MCVLFRCPGFRCSFCFVNCIIFSASHWTYCPSSLLDYDLVVCVSLQAPIMLMICSSWNVGAIIAHCWNRDLPCTLGNVRSCSWSVQWVGKAWLHPWTLWSFEVAPAAQGYSQTGSSCSPAFLKRASHFVKVSPSISHSQTQCLAGLWHREVHKTGELFENL